MSDSPREPILPAGFKDLLELIESEQETEKALAQVEPEVADYGRKVAPIIFARLCRTIDHDLLFTSETDLVMPDIKKMTGQFLHETTPKDRATRLNPWMIEIISREVRIYVLARKMIGESE